MGTSAISVEGLRKSYGNKVVLDDVHLHVSAGTVTALLGQNGAGKTTTIHILSTLIRADAGTAAVAGCDVVSCSGLPSISRLPPSSKLSAGCCLATHWTGTLACRSGGAPSSSPSATPGRWQSTNGSRCADPSLPRRRRRRGVRSTYVQDTAPMPLFTVFTSVTH